VGRRERILGAAADLIHARSFQATTIQDVADEVEFSKAAFYYFVKSKEDLLHQILLRALERVRAIASGPGAPDHKLLLVVDAYARMVAERPDTFWCTSRSAPTFPPRTARPSTDLERQIVAELRGPYAQGVAAGGLRDLPVERPCSGCSGM
jgi:AcrR family transcriptional regulator